MLPEANKELIARILEAISTGDTSVLAEHPGYRITAERLPMLRSAFPDLSATIVKQVAEGDHVATYCRMSGTHSGMFLGLAPTGKVIQYQQIAVDRIENGKVTEHNGAPDFLQVFRQLGITDFSPLSIKPAPS
ncbi:ester cyclase [Deinococcus oregonensis]|uniref:Ester cyclase n=1 Tax=Deinococcus oregonensis TaxID=1805970 RepID=A0ABV6B5X6_9DEIO